MAENSIRSMIQREARQLLPEIEVMKVVSESPLEMVAMSDSSIHIDDDSLIIPARLMDGMTRGKQYYALQFQDTNLYYILDEQ